LVIFYQIVQVKFHHPKNTKITRYLENTPVSEHPMRGYEDDLDLGEKSYKSDKEFLEVAATYRPPKMHINQNNSLG